MSIIDNLTPEQREGVIAGAKLGTVWAAVGITTWADFAAFMAAIYSVLLVGEFVWKKMLRRELGKRARTRAAAVTTKRKDHDLPD